MSDKIEISYKIPILFPIKYIKLKLLIEENFWERHFNKRGKR